ncbi:acyl carrier protein [Kitasatospora sp. NPDC058218]|uniref:acyl carrier protein n=1 Tax=Kitasatospora sp. NPDC058218 TaxID=3346385 RepID=UPI0036DD7364
MAEMTLDELKGFLLQAMGEDDSLDLSGDILDTGLTELGFDSLAIIDTTNKVERHFGIKLPESEASDIETPRDFLDVVNRAITVAA